MRFYRPRCPPGLQSRAELVSRGDGLRRFGTRQLDRRAKERISSCDDQGTHMAAKGGLAITQRPRGGCGNMDHHPRPPVDPVVRAQISL